MILDEDNHKFYVNNEVIDLSIAESSILSILIKNKNRYISISRIENNPNRYKIIRSYINRINEKMNNHIKIVNKYKLGYKIVTNGYDEEWKNIFFKNNHNYYIILKKYEKIEDKEKEIQKLKKDIRKLEKDINLLKTIEKNNC